MSTAAVQDSRISVEMSPAVKEEFKWFEGFASCRDRRENRYQILVKCRFSSTVRNRTPTSVTKEWYTRIQFRGERQFFSLGTPNKAAAAAKARDIYLSLLASGSEITLQAWFR